MQLTAAGRALLGEARRALAASDAARGRGGRRAGLLRGPLAIGTLQCLHVVHLPAVLAAFLDTYPGLEIGLRHGGSGDLTDQVAQGRLDVAFVSRPARCPDDVVVTSLAEEPLVLACVLDHPFAARPQVAVADLRVERLSIFSGTGVPGIWWTRCWGTARWRWRSLFRLPGIKSCGYVGRYGPRRRRCSVRFGGPPGCA